MSDFDANTGSKTTGLLVTAYGATVSELFSSDIIDTINMNAFTCVVQFDFIDVDLANTFVSSGATIVTSDDAGMANPETLTTLTGDINGFNLNFGLLSQARFFAKAGATGNKRYIQLRLNVDYTENINSRGVFLLGHVQYEPLVQVAE